MLELIAADTAESPSWTDKLEAWSTFGGAIVAALAAAATVWLLIHQIRETRRARDEATKERDEATADRELARQDREFAAAERRDQEATQARATVMGSFSATSEIHNSLSRFWIRLSVSNYSAEPILELAVLLRTHEGEYWKLWSADYLGPGGEVHIEENLQPDPPVLALGEAQPILHFTDAHGRRWSRHLSGQPSRVTEQVPVWRIPMIYTLEEFDY